MRPNGTAIQAAIEGPRVIGAMRGAQRLILRPSGTAIQAAIEGPHVIGAMRGAHRLILRPTYRISRKSATTSAVIRAKLRMCSASMERMAESPFHHLGAL